MAELSLPKEVNYAPRPHLPENVTTTLLTVLPTTGSNSFRASSVIQFDLPSRAGLYLQGSTAFLRYRLRYTSGATAGVIKGTPAITPFFKVDEFINSSNVSSVYNWNQVANMYVNTHLGISEKMGVQAALCSELKTQVANDTATDSLTLAASQASLAGSISLSTPLYCTALGSCDKFLPTGLMGQYRIQFTVAQLADIAVNTTNLSDFSIENCELCIMATDMGAGVDAMVASMGEKIYLKATGFANQGQQIPTAFSGVFSGMYNHRYQSINNLFLLASGSTAASDVNGIFDSRDVTSNNGSYSFQVGNQMFPSLPINTAVNKNGAMHYLRECVSSLTDWKYSMGINAVEWGAYLGSLSATAVNGFTPTAATTPTEPSKFIIGVSISKISNYDAYGVTSLLSGVSAAQSPIIANIQIGTATGQPYNLYLIAEYDILIEIDPATRSVNVIA